MSAIFFRKRNFLIILWYLRYKVWNMLWNPDVSLAPVGSLAPPCCQAGGMGWFRCRVNQAFWSQCFNLSPQLLLAIVLLRINSLVHSPLLFIVVSPPTPFWEFCCYLFDFFKKLLLAILRIKAEFIFERLSFPSFPFPVVELIRGRRHLNRLMSGRVQHSIFLCRQADGLENCCDTRTFWHFRKL